MGLLFQPRWSADRPRHCAPPPHGDVPFDRGVVFLTALEAVVLGDASRFSELFTEDVVFSSPHLTVESLDRGPARVGRARGLPDRRPDRRARARFRRGQGHRGVARRCDVHPAGAVRRPAADRADWRRGPPARSVSRRVPTSIGSARSVTTSTTASCSRVSPVRRATCGGRAIGDRRTPARLTGVVGRVQQAGLGSDLDGPATRRRAELAVDGDRLRLHRVARDVQAIGDLARRRGGWGAAAAPVARPSSARTDRSSANGPGRRARAAGRPAARRRGRRRESTSRIALASSTSAAASTRLPRRTAARARSDAGLEVEPRGDVDEAGRGAGGTAVGPLSDLVARPACVSTSTLTASDEDGRRMRYRRHRAGPGPDGQRSSPRATDRARRR